MFVGGFRGRADIEFSALDRLASRRWDKAAGKWVEPSFRTRHFVKRVQKAKHPSSLIKQNRSFTDRKVPASRRDRLPVIPPPVPKASRSEKLFPAAHLAARKKKLGQSTYSATRDTIYQSEIADRIELADASDILEFGIRDAVKERVGMVRDAAADFTGASTRKWRKKARLQSKQMHSYKPKPKTQAYSQDYQGMSALDERIIRLDAYLDDTIEFKLKPPVPHGPRGSGTPGVPKIGPGNYADTWGQQAKRLGHGVQQKAGGAWDWMKKNKKMATMVGGGLAAGWAAKKLLWDKKKNEQNVTVNT